MACYNLGKMTWTEVETIVPAANAVLVPVGATEQHGPHMALDTDYFISMQLAERTAKEAEKKGLNVVITPPITVGASWYHMAFPGTISLSQKTFIAVIKEYVQCLWRHGFEKVIIINSHGGNTIALNLAITELYTETRKRVLLAQWFAGLTADSIRELGIQSPMIHAEEVETSLALAVGQRVLMDKAAIDCFDREVSHQNKGYPTSCLIHYDALNPGPIFTPMDYMEDVTQFGIIGDATKATVEKGQKLLDEIVHKLVRLISDINGTTDHFIDK